MKITRKGSDSPKRTKKKPEGESTIVPECEVGSRGAGLVNDGLYCPVRWEASSKSIVVTAYHVPWEGQGYVHHDVEIRLTMKDLAAILAQAKTIHLKGDANLVKEAMSQSADALVTLLACATGVLPVPQIPPEHLQYL